MEDNSSSEIEMERGMKKKGKEKRIIENSLWRAGEWDALMWTFLHQPPLHNPRGQQQKFHTYFFICEYWPFVPDVNGFHFGIQTEMDDLLNAVGLKMKASMNDVVALQVKHNHSIRVTNYCSSSETRRVN